MGKLEEKIINIIGEELYGSLGMLDHKINIEDNLQDDLGTDSLDAVTIVLKLEEVFSISIEDQEVEKIKTVSEIVECVRGKIGETQ
jgi:acyl carrier protein